MNGVVEVVAGIVWRDGRFLAVERPQGKPQAGFWEFPGGKVERGESLEDALVRELREELDLTPTDMELWQEKRHDYEHISVRLHFFHVHAHSGAVVPHEGHAWRWFVPGETGDVPFLAADTEIVDELARWANAKRS
ncbi:8-oxo-dGTP diphosphatase [Desulfobaculum xiamenense]|uniref:8-oxo-dGTP diphosphatase n=1 Tax=Desulfobaculum xiamenense TaxID=995050 RepID=A0A846QJS7_9BACT|nr:(deoxy)nucleoside triphosphate pyrophosphohydrolase [Desulfobaculum xiamenense]NJB67320.1 8-oxo-dGTP diphosphatase [Desulfobaculum xiamenense]